MTPKKLGALFKFHNIGLVNEEQNEKETDKHTPAPEKDPTTA